ncbi:hypothetical protein UlMin_008273 [Ulmus minor]
MSSNGNLLSRRIVKEERKNKKEERKKITIFLFFNHKLMFYYFLCNFILYTRAVNGHLDILRPAIKNYGGSVKVLSVEGEDCVVKYVGPESIGLGIKAAIKEKFPDVVNVIFTH